MEVLEEEEIKEMKSKQRYFEELRNRELMEAERLEDAEKRRFDENVSFNKGKNDKNKFKILKY